MKLNLTLSKLASITGGTLRAADPRAPFQSFVTDSRVLAKGDAFWALKGRNHDAHRFIGDVVKKGASVIIDIFSMDDRTGWQEDTKSLTETRPAGNRPG